MCRRSDGIQKRKVPVAGANQVRIVIYARFFYDSPGAFSFYVSALGAILILAKLRTKHSEYLLNALRARPK